jgi:hypothetical protein
MKFFYFILFFVSLFAFKAQSPAPEIKISSVKLGLTNRLATVKDIIPGLAACNINSCKLTFSLKGSVKEFGLASDSLTPETRMIISGFRSGQKFFIEDIKSNCPDKKVFTIKVI